MSPPALRISGQPARLGKRIGAGGEGDVYFVDGRANEAVKLYKDGLRDQREAKVRAMVSGRLSERTSLVAFPLEVATDSSGRFAGFAMRLVSACRPIHELYGPKSRKIQFPKADYRFLVRAAQNVARAVAAVHEIDCIIGDFNHSGVLVSTNATIALIDADSFQFRSGNQLFRCIVGTEDFTPPELHGAKLGEVERTKAHDHFGLAVAIFQLLAMGRHPYAGRCPDADLSLGESIAQNRFAFSVARRDQTRTTPPPGSIRLEDFPPPIAQAFEAAFGLHPDNRPTAAQWVAMLQQLESELQHCTRVSGHYYPASSAGCPWCRLANQSGIDLFPVQHPVETGPGQPHFDLESLTSALRTLVLPSIEDLIPAQALSSGTPPPAAANARTTHRKRRWARSLWAIVPLVGFAWMPSLVLFWLFGVAIVAMYVIAAKPDETPLIQAFVAADARVQEAALAYLRAIGYVDALSLRAELEGWVDQYRGLDRELATERARLQSTRQSRHLQAYLDGFLIRRAKISGIGPAKTATLASFGIESAADVTRLAILAVPGFGDALTGKLLQWRQSHESKFRYNAQQDTSDEQADLALRAALATKRVAIQTKLRAGLANLKLAHTKLGTANALSYSPLRSALESRMAAEQACVELKVVVPTRKTIEVSVPRRVPRAPSNVSSPVRPLAAHAQSPACPQCGSLMVLRTIRSGAKAGHQFWGCSQFPGCRGSRNFP